MKDKEISQGVVHNVPPDLRVALVGDVKSLGIWNGLTPLARNEWICWVTSAKKPETGSRGLEMSLSKVNAGHVAGQAVLIADQRRKNGFGVERKGVRSHCSQCVSWDATVFPSLNLCTQSLYS